MLGKKKGQMRQTFLQIIICLGFVSFWPLETTYAKSFGTVLKSNGIEYVCYKPVDHTDILAAIAERNACLKVLDDMSQDPKWYENKWLWMGVGAVVSGSIVYGVTR